MNLQIHSSKSGYDDRENKPLPMIQCIPGGGGGGRLLFQEVNLCCCRMLIHTQVCSYLLINTFCYSRVWADNKSSRRSLRFVEPTLLCIEEIFRIETGKLSLAQYTKYRVSLLTFCLILTFYELGKPTRRSSAVVCTSVRLYVCTIAATNNKMEHEIWYKGIQCARYRDAMEIPNTLNSIFIYINL